MLQKPFEHESLLIDKKELQLTKKEKQLAKQSYVMEKRLNVSYTRPSYAAFYPKGAEPMHRPQIKIVNPPNMSGWYIYTVILLWCLQSTNLGWLCWSSVYLSVFMSCFAKTGTTCIPWIIPSVTIQLKYTIREIVRFWFPETRPISRGQVEEIWSRGTRILLIPDWYTLTVILFRNKRLTFRLINV